MAARSALLTTALAGAWTLYVWLFGGGSVQLSGVRISSHDWRRPALLALAGLVVFVRVRSATRSNMRLGVSPFVTAFAVGGLIGCLVFLWVYLGAYLEHPAFPEDHLLNSLIGRDPSRWQGPIDVLKDVAAYPTVQSFTLVFLLGTLAWLPWSGVDRRTRHYCVWFLFVSLVVLLVPLRFNDFSVWKTFFQPLPGFSVIRDPKRIIYVYELAVVIGTGLFMTRLPRKSRLRTAIAPLLLLLLIRNRDPVVFDFLRSNDAHDRWVQAPIDIDASCSCFFVRGASHDYSARSGDMWTLYGIDSMFVALNHSIPTLNGYSAWYPEGWALMNPHDPGYPEAVRRWVDRHELGGVCEFDIEKRTMRPYRTTRAPP